MYEAGYNLPENFTVKAKDGVTDLYGVMWKPADFDPEKKYPIISYVYPGPQVEPYPTSFSIGGTAARAHSLSRSEEHTSELQSRGQLVCRLLLEKRSKTM